MRTCPVLACMQAYTPPPSLPAPAPAEKPRVHMAACLCARAQVLEIESLGVRLRNLKRFMVLNPTGIG